MKISMITYYTHFNVMWFLYVLVKTLPHCNYETNIRPKLRILYTPAYSFTLLQVSYKVLYLLIKKVNFCKDCYSCEQTTVAHTHVRKFTTYAVTGKKNTELGICFSFSRHRIFRIMFCIFTYFIKSCYRLNIKIYPSLDMLVLKFPFNRYVEFNFHAM